MCGRTVHGAKLLVVSAELPPTRVFTHHCIKLARRLDNALARLAYSKEAQVIHARFSWSTRRAFQSSVSMHRPSGSACLQRLRRLCAAYRST